MSHSSIMHKQFIYKGSFMKDVKRANVFENTFDSTLETNKNIGHA